MQELQYGNMAKQVSRKRYGPNFSFNVFRARSTGGVNWPKLFLFFVLFFFSFFFSFHRRSCRLRLSGRLRFFKLLLLSVGTVETKYLTVSYLFSPLSVHMLRKVRTASSAQSSLVRTIATVN